MRRPAAFAALFVLAALGWLFPRKLGRWLNYSEAGSNLYGYLAVGSLALLLVGAGLYSGQIF